MDDAVVVSICDNPGDPARTNLQIINFSDPIISILNRAVFKFFRKRRLIGVAQKIHTRAIIGIREYQRHSLTNFVLFHQINMLNKDTVY